MKVYDKAKWHHDAEEYPRGLPNEQAHVHIGFVLAWLVKSQLISALFRDDFQDEITQVERRTLTGPALLRIADGALVDDMVTDEAAQFLLQYYSPESGGFWGDYESCFDTGSLESVYHVVDTWENCDAFSAVLDARFSAWRAGGGTVKKG